MEKLSMKTISMAERNFTVLSRLFPQVITETVNENGVIVRAVDPEKLAQEINTHVLSDKEERYQFTWADKQKSVLLANAPINKALRPCREESVDFDNTENLYIEGDNLDVLKLLRETYLNRIKMIYIDPPYNTGNDFIYNDDFAMDTDEWAEISGDYEEYGNRLVKNLDSNGRFHTDWLNMIYPRLRLARDLLTNDGVILINMDENEIVNLQKICYEIFGEYNDLGTIIWDKRNPKGDARGISYQHEYIAVFAKNKELFLQNCKMQRPKKNAKTMLAKAKQFFNKINLSYTFEQANKDYAEWIRLQPILTGGEKAYNSFDSKGDVYQSVSMAWPNKEKAPDDYFVPLIHPKTNEPCPVPERGWRNPSSTMQTLLEKGLILFGNDETTQPRRKYLLKENMYDKITSLLYYGGSDTDMLAELGIPFDTPKVVDIVIEHIQSFTNDNDIILDFFSGSATTAHAVMQLNAEDGGKRKFICVQLPEECDVKSEAFKAGYKNICEIGKERIRMAGQEIKDEIEKGNEQLSLEGESCQVPDIGFRVLKLAGSNMRDIYYAPAEFAEKYEQDQLDELETNIKSDRSPEDLLFQVMLEFGMPLSSKIEVREIAGADVFYVGHGDEWLAACFGKVNNEIATEIALSKPMYAVFRDDGFENDSALINAEQAFATHSPDTERRVL